MIREMRKEDWPQVSMIYLHGIKTNRATFQTEVPDYEEWDQAHLSDLRYVMEEKNEIIGWIALSPTSSRAVYKGVCELSVYIHQNHMHKSVGKKLMHHMIEASEKADIWTLYSSIMSDNVPSIRLHEACGFRTIGYREKIARDSFGYWRDTVLMERRSKNIL